MSDAIKQLQKVDGQKLRSQYLMNLKRINSLEGKCKSLLKENKSLKKDLDLMLDLLKQQLQISIEKGEAELKSQTVSQTFRNYKLRYKLLGQQKLQEVVRQKDSLIQQCQSRNRRLQKELSYCAADGLLKQLDSDSSPSKSVSIDIQIRKGIEEILKNPKKYCPNCKSKLLIQRGTEVEVPGKVQVGVEAIELQELIKRKQPQFSKLDYIRKLYVSHLIFLEKNQFSEAQVLQEGLLRLLECTEEDRLRAKNLRNSIWYKIKVF